MAYNDLAQFLPQEGGFRRPGQFDRMLKAEALKKASYLAAMDEFYAQLEETARQFDLNLGQRNKEFRNMLDLRRDMRNIQYGQLGLGAAGLLSKAYLKNKEITSGYDYMDRIAQELGGYKALLGFDKPSPISLPEVPEYDYGDLTSGLEFFGDSGGSEAIGRTTEGFEFDIPEISIDKLGFSF